jgi:predicted RecA/RadA family phage recombinase
MSKNYSGEGKRINVTLAAAQVAGTPFPLGNLLVMPITSGEIGDTIACDVDGVWNLPKADAAVIAQGETVNWDVSAGNIDDNAATPATGDLSGGCIAMEGKGATTGENILVKLNVGPNTVT